MNEARRPKLIGFMVNLRMLGPEGYGMLETQEGEAPRHRVEDRICKNNPCSGPSERRAPASSSLAVDHDHDALRTHLIARFHPPTADLRGRTTRSSLHGRPRREGGQRAGRDRHRRAGVRQGSSV